VEKQNSVIVYAYNKYLLEQPTRQINFSNQQLYSAVILDGLQCYYNIASKRAFPTGVPDR